MIAVEEEIGDLRELVDGQESWSHRKRLHTLENDRRAVEIVGEALAELRAVRRGKTALLREWFAVVIAAAAVLVSIWAKFHGAG